MPKPRDRESSMTESWLRRIELIMSVLFLGTFAALVCVLLTVSPWEFQYGAPAGLQPVLCAILVPVAAACVLFLLLPFSLTFTSWNSLRKLHHVIFVLVAVAFSWFLYSWNLIGLNY